MPIRIYALAKKMGIDNKELLTLCDLAGVAGKGSALASISSDEVKRVEDFMRDQKEKAEGQNERTDESPAADHQPMRTFSDLTEFLDKKKKKDSQKKPTATQPNTFKKSSDSASLQKASTTDTNTSSQKNEEKTQERRRSNLKKNQSRLRHQITECLANGSPACVDLSRPRHGVTTPILREFVYHDAHKNGMLPVVFRDGSKPTEFPIGRLSEAPMPTRVPTSEIVRLGLMSFRHPELDYIVDRYVATNRELGGNPSVASEERLAFERSIEILSDSCAKVGGEIWVYHTGFEPMVIGFYRAVTEILATRISEGRDRNFLIQPCLYSGPRSEPPFTRESPGANPNMYRLEDPWW